MIADTQRHQVHSYHLALSVILLFLTVYPYLFNPNNICCSVAAYSADDLELRHSSIESFDIIDSNELILSKLISKRHTRDQQQQPHEQLRSNNNPSTNGQNYDSTNAMTSNDNSNNEQIIERVHFSSLGRRFNLVLDRPAHLTSDDLTIVVLDAYGRAKIVPYNRNDFQILEGHLERDSKSRATTSFSKENKLMTAHIRTGQDTIIVEPTYLHRDKFLNAPLSNTTSAFLSSSSKLYDKTMIVYKLSDHEQFNLRGKTNNQSFLFNPGKLCRGINMSEYDYEYESKSSSPSEDDVFKIYKPKKLNYDKRINKRGIEFSVEQYKERTRCTLHLVADYLFYKHVGNGDLQTTINYLLALINRVNQIYLPTVWEAGDDKVENFNNIGFTVQNITIHQEYTQLTSTDDHYNMRSDRIWTAREFLDNFSRHSPPRHFCLAHLLTYRQFDSPVLGLAYVASTRYGTIGGICSPMQQKDEIYYKHNTGISTSKGINNETLITRQADLVLAHELGHNLGAEHDSNECRPGPSNGGAYLMHPYAVMGFEKNNRFLSNCSRIAIGRVIRRKASSCFVAVADNICGNGVVEDDEECDGGDVGHGHSDPCCDRSCRFTPGSQCSDRHSWCCSKCRIVPFGRPCRPAEEFNCKQASVCNGQSADCPAPDPVEDDKICVGRGLCRRGECVPFCEARELYSCLCNSSVDACKLCCKQSINSTCVPYDQKAPYLPDGVLCYKGVCEKGRCEQPIQDVIERLWDVIEDINFTTFVKFLRDNIIIVVLVASIPTWCILAHYINDFDKRIKQDVISAMIKRTSRRRTPIGQSPFLPRLFVGDEISNANSSGELNSRDEAHPFKPQQQQQLLDATGQPSFSPSNGGGRYPPPHRPTLGFRAPNYGFQLPPSEEEVVIEPGASIALNSIELPHGQQSSWQGDSGGETNDEGNGNNENTNFTADKSYSTQV